MVHPIGSVSKFDIINLKCVIKLNVDNESLLIFHVHILKYIERLKRLILGMILSNSCELNHELHK